MRKSTIIKRIGCLKKTIGVAIVLLGGIMVLTVPAAQAVTSVQTVSWADAYTYWTSNGTINKFDSSLGTLTEVKIEFTSNLSGGTGDVKNLYSGANKVYYTFSETGTLSIGSVNLVAIAETDMLTKSFTTSGTAAVTLSGTQTGFDSFTSSSAADLAAFTGTGTVSYTVDSTDSSYYNGSQKGAENGTYTSRVGSPDGIQSNGGFTVTYTYTSLSVPEPSSSLIFLLGLVGIAGLNRRFRSQPEDPVASIHWSDWGFRNQDEI